MTMAQHDTVDAVRAHVAVAVHDLPALVLARRRDDDRLAGAALVIVRDALADLGNIVVAHVAMAAADLHDQPARCGGKRDQGGRGRGRHNGRGHQGGERNGLEFHPKSP